MLKNKFVKISFAAILLSSIIVGVAAADGRIFIGDNDEKDNATNTEPTISEDEAIAIAENATGGQAIAENATVGQAPAVELENEDGYLVYGVLIQNADGIFDVKVDAGSGVVLKIESGNDDGPDGPDGEKD